MDYKNLWIVPDKYGGYICDPAATNCRECDRAILCGNLTAVVACRCDRETDIKGDTRLYPLTGQ